jgi:hypothetical protein
MKRRIALAFVFMLSFALAAHADNNDDKKTTPMPVRITIVDTNLQVLSTTTNALNIEKVVSWVPHAALGLDVPELDFMSGQGAKLSVQLIFDTLEAKEDVYEKHIRALENLAKVDQDRHRPPIVLVTWGGNKNFKGVVESLNVKYTMFLSDGRPARAEVVLSVRETNVARPPI